MDARTQTPLPANDAATIQSFEAALAGRRLAICRRCEQAWFEMDLQDRVCKRCLKLDKGKATYFYSALNLLQPSLIYNLEPLSEIEEQLVASAQVVISVRKIGKQRGYTAQHLRENVWLSKSLPVRPEKLAQIVFAPRNFNAAHRRQFAGVFQVRRYLVEKWLGHYIHCHSGYKDVTVDEGAMSELPEDGDIMDMFIRQTDEFITAVSNPPPPEVHAVPDIVSFERPNIPEVDDRPGFPVSEFKKYPLVSLMFPTLFPNGQAEFVMPRLRAIEWPDYVEHLLKQKCGSFIGHKAFLMSIYNLTFQRQVCSQADYYARQHKTDSTFTAEELLAACSEDSLAHNALLSSILHQAESITGSPPFWNTQRRKLRAMVRQLGPPNMFCSFSSALEHWNSLAKLYPDYETWKRESRAERRARSARKIEAHPHIAAQHFESRFDLFFKTVLKPRYNIADWWYQIEWQAGGAPHFHAVFWISNPPSEAEFNTFWSNYVEACNPDPGRPAPSPDAPSALQSPFINTTASLATAVNHAQMHSCVTNCNLDNSCRYGYPRPPHADGTVAVFGGFSRFDPPRDDGRLVGFDPVVIMSWLASTDIQPCVNVESANNDIDSFLSKPHSPSATYKDLVENIMPAVNTGSMEAMVTSLLCRFFSSRDVCSQEVCHMLLRLPLVHSSRDFINVDCYVDEKQSGLEPRGSLVKRFMERGINIENVPLASVVHRYNTEHAPTEWTPLSRDNERIPLYLPRYPSDKDTPRYDDYCRTKLMLNHPFRTFDQLKIVQGQHFPTFTQAYEKCLEIHNHVYDLYAPEDFDADWNALAAQMPGSAQSVAIGHRPVDLKKDWSTHVGHRHVPANWLEVTQRNHPPAPTRIDPGTLNEDQRKMFDRFRRHYEDSLNAPTEPLRMDVEGRSGSGKTYAVKAIVSHLRALAEAYDQPDPVIIITSVGRADAEIDGTALHTTLRIPDSPGAYVPLTSFPQKFANCRYLVIDEKSMISLSVMSWIDKRLRQIKNNDTWLGGLSVILSGDFWQPMPVSGLALFTPEPENDEDRHGRRVYESFNVCCCLKTIMRQQDPGFLAAIEGLRTRDFRPEHLQTLSKRVATQPVQSKALRIYTKSEKVDAANEELLRSTNQPVVWIQASHFPSTAVHATTDQANGLRVKFPICIGARIMITKNLWIERGIVNGALGTVEDIVWAEGTQDPRNALPAAILVVLDKYDGPSLYCKGDGKPVIPILPREYHFYFRDRMHWRTQFPMTLAHAITAHEARGMTEVEVVVNLNDEEIVAGLAYVAVSRVKTLEGLTIEEPIDYQRIKAREKRHGHAMLLADEERREKLSI